MTTKRFTPLAEEKNRHLRSRVKQLEDQLDRAMSREQALRERVKKLERTQEALFVAFVAILAVCVALWKVVG